MRLLGLFRGRNTDVTTTSLASVPFAEAAAQWLESRKLYLSPAAQTRYRFYLRPLQAFFQEMKLTEITPDLIRAYQRARVLTVSATVVNHECSCLQQMLKRIQHWSRIAGDYQPLPLPRQTCGRALSDPEYGRLFRLARLNPNWRAVALLALLSVNTTASPGEVKTLHLANVSLEECYIEISQEGSKNPERQRVIPLNPRGLEAAREAVARARSLGACQGDHYLFPFRVRKGKYDPTRHQTSFKTAWRELTAAADVHNFRLEDLRHHAITVLLKNPRVAGEVTDRIAGHVSAAMRRRYGHIEMDDMRKAVAAMTAPDGKSKLA